ncbi:hypothetical protein GGS21DRAFT_199294 [Xylaria nigripes]|nr:hypothetical protein GGS21DRAFT_199294 [Xylaria nigripes]
MCFHLIKGFRICRHPDPEATPKAVKHCTEYLKKGGCKKGTITILTDQVKPTTGFCPQCQDLRNRFFLSTGSLDTAHKNSATWKLYNRIGWEFKNHMFLDGAASARFHLDYEITTLGGRDQEEFTATIEKRIDFYEAFKEWLAERLGKKDPSGRPYFPQIELPQTSRKTTRLQYLVRWMLQTMADKDFDGLAIDKVTFKKCLRRSFNELIYDWEMEFLDDPGIQVAGSKFQWYWNRWATRVIKDSS